MKPSIGQIVHYHRGITSHSAWADQPSAALRTFPAIITDIRVGTGEGTVSLTVFEPNRTDAKPIVFYSDTPRHNRWTWPPRD